MTCFRAEACASSPRLRQQEFSGVGHHDAARMPHEQLLFKILFQLADLQAQRRLGDVQQLGRLGEILQLGDGDERL